MVPCVFVQGAIAPELVYPEKSKIGKVLVRDL
jgi:hypothetical protein